MAKTIGVFVEQDYQELEFWYPVYRLREAGHNVIVIGSGTSERYLSKLGYPAEVDTEADRVNADDLDGLVIPGGWAPDFLRRHEAVNALVRECFGEGKVVAAICHAGSVLVSAGVLAGRTVTGFASIRADLEAAGARYVDRDVVVDGNLVTSRKPDDLPSFCRELLKALEHPARKPSPAGEPRLAGRVRNGGRSK
ncbi:MAG: type 1 glutamine amidotransferase [Elusimicrobia bacterium]|nr:type 1 glutamine amidotransferase [Elusimicrobiota bacterium]